MHLPLNSSTATTIGRYSASQHQSGRASDLSLHPTLHPCALQARGPVFQRFPELRFSWQGLPGSSSHLTRAVVRMAVKPVIPLFVPFIRSSTRHAAGLSQSRWNFRFDVGVPVKNNLPIFDAHHITSKLHRPASTGLHNPAFPKNLISM